MKVIKKDAYQMIGFRSQKEPAQFWAEVKADHRLKQLQNITHQQTTYGLCFKDQGYMIAVESDHEDAHYDTYRALSAHYAWFIAEGKISEQTLAKTWEIARESIANDPIISNRTDLPSIEEYLNYDPIHDTCLVHLYLPIK